ncbi:hypothetical protein CLF_106189, partial [Clonorchis sinensis]
WATLLHFNNRYCSHCSRALGRLVSQASERHSEGASILSSRRHRLKRNCTSQPNHLKHDVRYGAVQKPKYGSAMMARHCHTQFDSTPATNPFLLSTVPFRPLGPLPATTNKLMLHSECKLMIMPARSCYQPVVNGPYYYLTLHENNVCMLHIDKAFLSYLKTGVQKTTHMCPECLKLLFHLIPRYGVSNFTEVKQTQAIYFSVIRPFIDAPSLTAYLEKYFMNKCIERRIIFRTFGCLLDFLIRLKSSGFSHMYYFRNLTLYPLIPRNLHPNNIFIDESEAYTTDCWSSNLANYIRGTDFFQLAQVQTGVLYTKVTSVPICCLCKFDPEFDHLYDPSLVTRVPIECPPEPQFRRRKPRLTEWCAPEVDNFQYNDRSDLWSLACMMQIMLNVKDLTAGDMNWALQTLKSNPKSFFPLNNQSTEDEVKFVKILNSMLEPDPEKRVSLEQLLQDPFVEAILKQTDPESMARANRCIVRMADRLLPAEDGERAVRDYLIRNWRHENCVEGAVIWFAERCCHSNAGLPPHMSGVLFNVLDLHKANGKLVHNALIVLNHYVYLGHAGIELPPHGTESRAAENDQNGMKELKYDLENEDFVIILNAMKQHPENLLIQEAALKLLDSLLGAAHSNVDVDVVRNYLATRQHVFAHLIKIGFITYLLELLQSHMYELARLGAEYLWKYCLYAPIARIVGESKALITVLYLMRNYPEDIKLFTGGPLLILASSSSVGTLLLSAKVFLEYDNDVNAND